MIVNDITITSLETITAFNITTGAYMFTLEELQDATLSQTQDTADITGRGGRLLNTLKKSKAVTISGTNGLISSGLLELQTGASFENKATNVMWTDYTMTVSSNQAEGQYKAVGTTGAEIDALYVLNADGTRGQQLTQAASAASGKFTYAPSTKTFTFSGLADGTKIVAYYKRKITADVLENDSSTFSGKCTLFIDCLGEDKCANIYHVQIYIPKADFNGEWSLEMGGDQTVHAFDANALSGGCAGSTAFFTYTVFAENTGDTP